MGGRCESTQFGWIKTVCSAKPKLAPGFLLAWRKMRNKAKLMYIVCIPTYGIAPFHVILIQNGTNTCTMGTGHLLGPALGR